MKTKGSWGKVNPFYQSKEWRALREEKLEQSPICELCETIGLVTPANVVDHIIPIEVNEELKLEPLNLQSLCEHQGSNNCHRQKTVTTRPFRSFGRFVKEMEDGKLRFICSPEARDKLLRFLKEKAL